MTRLFADRIQHQRATGDRLGMLIRIGQSNEQAPPVINQCGDSGHRAATLQVLGGKAAPAPVIFQFVKVVLGIGAVSVQLGDAEDFVSQ